MTHRDIVDAILDIARGLLCIAVVAAAAFVLLTMCSGCAPVQRPATPLPVQDVTAQRTAQVAMQAWREAGLHVAPNTICRLAELRIVVDVDGLCGGNACLGWGGKYVPVAYVSPRLKWERSIAHAAHHEMMHALERCWLGRFDSDGGHTDRRVWEQYGPDTAEARGERALDAEPAWPPERAAR